MSLPKQLQLQSSISSTGEVHEASPVDAAVAAPDANTCHLFSLQNLTLKLAFENAKILIHRPLLSYKAVTTAQATNIDGHTSSTNISDPCCSSVQACRDAALHISALSASLTLKEATNTYAISFISLHLLTASVTLSMLTSLSPLSQEAHDCKMGIRWMMEVQSRLSATSVVAKQGLGVLKKLVSLELSKEAKQMLEMPNQMEKTGDTIEVAPNATIIRSILGDNQFRDENGPCESGPIEDYIANENSAGVEFVPDTVNSVATNPAIDFYEDPSITQALYEFEQGMLNTPRICYV